jgi:hypothetical protein
MANVGRGRGRGGRGEGRGNTDDSEPLLSRKVVWSDPLIEILLTTVPGRQGRQKLNKKIEIEKNEKLLERRVEKNNYSLKSMPNIK